MRKLVAILVVVVFALTACSSNDLAEQGERSRAGKDNNEGGGGGKAKGDGKSDGNDVAAPGEDDLEEVPEEVEAPPGGTAAGAGAPEDFGEDAPSSRVDPSLARASAGAEDSPSDAKRQGVAPPYTEATGAGIQGLGKKVRFTFVFSGSLPERVGKEQYMVVAFGITGNKEGEGFAVGATCDEKGWHPYAGAKGDTSKFPGKFQVSGNEVILELPWSFIEGPRAFEWYSSTGWYGKVANQTHWSFDSVPNDSAGKFPS